MKILYNLFLTAMVTITMERCRAKYLLVAVDDDDFRKPKNNDFRKINDNDLRKDFDDFKKPKNDDLEDRYNIVRDSQNDNKKCGGANSSHRLFRLDGKDANKKNCLAKCVKNENCVAFSGIWNQWCIGCDVKLTTKHQGAIAFKKDTVKGCLMNEKQCRNGICVPKARWCDGNDDCGDGSDEGGPVCGGSEYDCEWRNWSQWGHTICVDPCELGMQIRTRWIWFHEIGLGKPCPGDSIEFRRTHCGGSDTNCGGCKDAYPNGYKCHSESSCSNLKAQDNCGKPFHEALSESCKKGIAKDDLNTMVHTYCHKTCNCTGTINRPLRLGPDFDMPNAAVAKMCRAVQSIGDTKLRRTTLKDLDSYPLNKLLQCVAKRLNLIEDAINELNTPNCVY